MLLALLLTASLTPPAWTPLAQDPAEVLETQIDAFKDIIKAKKGGEPEAIEKMDFFVQRYRENRDRLVEIDETLELGDGDAKALKKEAKQVAKEQKLLAETVWYSFARKRPTKPHMDLWKAAAFAFGQMGADGAEQLWKAFEDKRFNDDVEFRALCVQQVGFTHDYEQAAELTDLLDYKDELVIAAAGEALAQFGGAPGKVRRDCTETLVKRLESYHNASTNYEDTNAIRIFRQVKDPMIRALTALTGQSFRDPVEWTRWWNDNKKDKELWQDPA